mgnify:CR=1 FL=1
MYQVWFKLAKLNLKKGFASDFNVFFTTLLLIPLKKAWTLFSQTKFTSTRIALPKKALCQAWLKWAQLFLIEWFILCSLYFPFIFPYFLYFIIALWKVNSPYLNKHESLSPMNALGHVWWNLVFVQSLLELCPVALGKRRMTTMMTRMYIGKKSIRNAQLSLKIRWGKTPYVNMVRVYHI